MNFMFNESIKLMVKELLVEHNIINILGDGNCQFRSIEEFLKNPIFPMNFEVDDYEDIRNNVIYEMTTFKDEYINYCDINYDEYINKDSNKVDSIIILINISR